MRTTDAKSCKLCHTAINDDNFEEITSITRDIFCDLLLNLNFDEEEEHVLCGACSTNLSAAMKFKSMCLNMNKVIIRETLGEKALPLDLKEVYAAKKKGRKLPDKTEICRLCTQLRNEYKPLRDVEVDVFQNYIPELNFSLTRDPVICDLCSEYVVAYSRFLKNCLKENIENPCYDSPETEEQQSNSLHDDYVEFEEIIIKCEEFNEETNEHNVEIKSEDEDPKRKSKNRRNRSRYKYKPRPFKTRKICSVPQCFSRCDNGISVHHFPRDQKLCREWQVKLRIGKPISKNMYVCSEHFLPIDFWPVRSPTARRMLKRGSVPSRNIPVRKHDTVKTKINRDRKWLKQ